MEYTKDSKVLTPIFRVSYAHIWQPQMTQPDNPNEQPKAVYSVVMVFDEDADLTELKKLANAVRVQAFGEGAKIKKVFKTDEDFDLEKNPYYAGKTIVTARSYSQAIIPVKRNPSVPKGSPGWVIPIKEQSEFYSGCYAVASVRAYSSNHPKVGKRVNFGLQSLMKIKDGEPFGNHSNPESDFAAIDPAIVAAADTATDSDYDDFDL